LKFLIAVLSLGLATPVYAEETTSPEALAFVVDNQLDRNLYNLLAATIPTTDAGQMLFEACGEVKIEALFEQSYDKLQEQIGGVWRGALADVYSRHLDIEEMAELSALEDVKRLDAIAERLTQEAVVDDLRASLSPLASEAVGRHANMMLDGAEQICSK